MDDREMRADPLYPKALAELYLTAKEHVIDSGFASEIDWQEDISLEKISESTFLRESAWVVLSTGFRETVLRRRFDDISRAFFHWSSAEQIFTKRHTCRANALKCFANSKKIDAVINIAGFVASSGIDQVICQIASRGREFLEELPFIGPVTSCHLAKNLGVPMVKPDRHLVRIATNLGYQSPDYMCQVISEVVGDSLSVIDLVLWRYATITHRNGLNVGIFEEYTIAVRQSSTSDGQ